MEVFLEDLVIMDMIHLGYDYTDPFDIQSYWELRLS
jgi:hypothetical protein